MLCGKIEPAWASEKYERWCSGVHPPTSHKHFSCSKLNTIFSVFPEHVAKHNPPPNFAKHGNRPQYNITSGSYCSLRGDKTLKLCLSAKCPRMRSTDNKLVHDSATRWHQNPANKQLAEQFGYRLQFAAPPPFPWCGIRIPGSTIRLVSQPPSVCKMYRSGTDSTQGEGHSSHNLHRRLAGDSSVRARSERTHSHASGTHTKTGVN